MVRESWRIKRIILIISVILSNHLALATEGTSKEENLDIVKAHAEYFNKELDSNSGSITLDDNSTPTNPMHNNINQKDLIKEEVPLTTQEQAILFYEKGTKALESNQEIEATTLFKQALHQDPNNHKARLQLIKLYQKIGWNDENERLLIEGLELAPDHTDFIKNLGFLYQQKGQMRKSLSILLTMPEKAYVETDYLALLALAYLNNEQPDLAINYYRELLKINRENPLWYLGLAVALNANGDYHSAIDNFNKAKKLGRFNPEILDYINTKILAMKSYE